MSVERGRETEIIHIFSLQRDTERDRENEGQIKRKGVKDISLQRPGRWCENPSVFAVFYLPQGVIIFWHRSSRGSGGKLIYFTNVTSVFFMIGGLGSGEIDHKHNIGFLYKRYFKRGAISYNFSRSHILVQKRLREN